MVARCTLESQIGRTVYAWVSKWSHGVRLNVKMVARYLSVKMVARCTLESQNGGGGSSCRPRDFFGNYQLGTFSLHRIRCFRDTRSLTAVRGLVSLKHSILRIEKVPKTFFSKTDHFQGLDFKIDLLWIWNMYISKLRPWKLYVFWKDMFRNVCGAHNMVFQICKASNCS